MEKLPLETQTLYAELIERLTAIEAERTMGHSPGCFTEKEVKGRPYYYYQYQDPGGRIRQIYIGRKTRELEVIAARYRSHREIVKTDLAHLQVLCAQLRAGGALMTDTASGRVLKALADSGIFYLDGILLGTQAFIVLGNLLGIRWDHSTLRTQDIDLGGTKKMSIALPEIKADLPGILEGLEMGFIPVPPFNPKHPSTSFRVRGTPLRLDVLTPEKHLRKSEPVFLPRFKVAAQPVRFLDYLIEDPIKGVIINGGGVLVNIPQPARFALHKLIVSQERELTFHSKIQKDMTQAAQLLHILLEERPGDLILAWEEIKKKGAGWMKRIKNALYVRSSPQSSILKRTASFLKI